MCVCVCMHTRIQACVFDWQVENSDTLSTFLSSSVDQEKKIKIDIIKKGSEIYWHHLQETLFIVKQNSVELFLV